MRNKSFSFNVEYFFMRRNVSTVFFHLIKVDLEQGTHLRLIFSWQEKIGLHHVSDHVMQLKDEARRGRG